MNVYKRIAWPVNSSKRAFIWRVPVPSRRVVSTRPRRALLAGRVGVELVLNVHSDLAACEVLVQRAVSFES